MDPAKSNQPSIHSPVQPGDILAIVENQKIQIAQLSSIVESQGTRLTHLSSEIESALSAAQADRNELRLGSQVAVSALSKIHEQLNSLTDAITSNASSPSYEVPAPPGLTHRPAEFDPAQIPLPVTSNEDPNFPRPMIYEGDLAKCRGFLAQCDLLFSHHTSRYPCDESKVAFVVSLLSGRALDWAVAVLKKTRTFYSNYRAFITEFRLVFDHSPVGSDVGSRLLTICQGNRSVAEYAVEFRLLAAECNWDDDALSCAFRRGLNESVKDKILLDQPDSLAALISLCLFVDDRLRARRLEKPAKDVTIPAKTLTDSRPPLFLKSPPICDKAPSSPSAQSEPEPMQLGRSRLTPTVRRQRIQNNLCLYCGSPDHMIQACNIRPKGLTH